MSFKLTCIITLGKYQFFGGINDCEIKRSVKAIVDTAVLKIPSKGRVNSKNELSQNNIDTSVLWTEGDAVSIQLGYNGENFQEFKGFVRRINASIPVTIECEGYAWQLRRLQLTGSWKSIQLRDFLALVVAGTDIKLSASIPDRLLTNLKMDAHHAPTRLKVLEYLNEKCLLSVYFIFDTLYVGLEEGLPGNRVKHALGFNTVRDDRLKWRNADDTPVYVQLVGRKGTEAKRPIYSAGTIGGAVIRKDVANLSAADAQAQADDLLQQAKYTGFEGSVTGFLQPFIQMCDTDVISDPLYKIRAGNYFTIGTEVHFGIQGATRKIQLGRAL